MQHLLMIYSKEDGWSKMTPAKQQQRMAAYTSFTEALKKSNVLVGSNRLRPVSTATTVRVTNGKSQILDGPTQTLRNSLAGTISSRSPISTLSRRESWRR